MALPVFVISLPGSPRRLSITARLAQLGIEFRFIDAVAGTKLTPAQITACYDDAASIRRIGRGLTKSEIGCALSHRLAYGQIIASKLPAAVILEDDAMPSSGLKDFIEASQPLPGKVALLQLYSGAGIRERRAAYHYRGHDIFRAASAIESSCAYWLSGAMAARLYAATTRISMVADWPLPARHLHQYLMLPSIVEHDFTMPSEIGTDRPSFQPVAKPFIRKIEGLKAFLFLRYLENHRKYDGLYNYYERELRVRIKARLPSRYVNLQRYEPRK